MLGNRHKTEGKKMARFYRHTPATPEQTETAANIAKALGIGTTAVDLVKAGLGCSKERAEDKMSKEILENLIYIYSLRLLNKK